LDTPSIRCSDLRTIDRLWVKYSDGRFGFSVQKRIWESVGGKPDTNELTPYDKFGDRVGWRKNLEWIDYANVSFSLNAPEGHLPQSFRDGFSKFYEGEELGGQMMVDKRFFSLVETCKL
jgi:hypothetical protein